MIDARATKEDILACFRLLLGREIHDEEMAPHSGQIGAPLDFVVLCFLQSMEFRQRGLLSLSDETEIVALDGFSIYVAKDDHLIAPGIRSGYEPEVTRVFLEHISDAGAVLDIGANCGYFALLAASRGATVYAFEPLQHNLRLLHASVAANNFPRVHIVSAAASDSQRTLMIAATYTNGVVGETPSNPQVALAAEYSSSVRVDDIVPRDLRVSLIKIDVEGHEYLAISGAAETIRRSKPVILSEFSPGQLVTNSKVSPAAYLDLLRSFNYQICAIGHPDITTNEELLKITDGKDHIDIVAESIERPCS